MYEGITLATKNGRSKLAAEMAPATDDMNDSRLFDLSLYNYTQQLLPKVIELLSVILHEWFAVDVVDSRNTIESFGLLVDF